MDSMEINKGVAAALVAGIVFFLTGLIGMQLVNEKHLEKPAIAIAGAPRRTRRRRAEAGSAAADRAAAGQGRRGDRRSQRRRSFAPPAIRSMKAAKPASGRTCMAWSAARTAIWRASTTPPG